MLLQRTTRRAFRSVPSSFRDEVVRLTKIVSISEFADMRLRLITPECDLFHATERDLPGHWNGTLPWWGFLWPGGYGATAYLIRHGDNFRERAKCGEIKRIVDFAAGCGITAVAAVRLDVPVVAVDVCPWAAAATRLNAELNGFADDTNTRLNIIIEDIIGSPLGVHIEPGDVIFCGDVLYDDDFARRLLPYLTELATSGVEIYVSDPGRWVLKEMSSDQRDGILSYVDTIELEEWFSRMNHGLTSSAIYKVRGDGDG